MSLNENIVLLTGHYNCKDIKRTREIKQCILANCLIFSKVVIMFENWNEVKDNCEYSYLITNEKIQLVEVDTRQTFKMYFEYAYEYLRDKFVVVSNSDIVFDITLNRLSEFNMENTLLALTRWQRVNKDDWSLYTLPLQGNTNMNWSYDSYIFKPELVNVDTNDLDIAIGVAGCDTYLVKKLSCQNINIKNPVYDIRSYHIDYRDLEKKDKGSNINGDTYWNREDYPMGNRHIINNINGFSGVKGLKLTTNDNVNVLWSGTNPLIQKRLTAITYCLWGSNPKYYQNIEKILSDSLEFYPDMTVILVVHEQTVDFKLLSFIDQWPNIILLKRNEFEGDYIVRTWRFQLIDSEHIDTIICRDLDSIILKREVLAVREWLKSNKRLHIMRDHPHHQCKMMAGMFGMKKLPYLKCKMKDIVDRYKDRGSEFEMDQIILRANIYPLCCSFNDVMVHASFNAHEIFAKPFPIGWDEEYNFVGSYVDTNYKSSTYYTDMIKNYNMKSIKAESHKDIIIINTDSNSHFLQMIIDKMNIIKQKQGSYCIHNNISEDQLNHVTKLSFINDNKKILIGINNNTYKWVLFHTDIVNDLCKKGIKGFMESTGDIITYEL